MDEEFVGGWSGERGASNVGGSVERVEDKRFHDRWSEKWMGMIWSSFGLRMEIARWDTALQDPLCE